MHVVDFLNYRETGKVRNKLFHENQYRPNLDYLLSKLSCKNKDVYLSENEGGFVPPFACKFRRDDFLDLLAVANEDGEIMLIDTDGGRGVVKSFTAHHNAIFDICWLPDKNHLITVSGDHSACLWDMNTCQKIGSFKKHIESIKSVDVCHNDNALFSTGSRDGSICIWDTRDKCFECGNSRDKPSISIQSAHCRKLVTKSKDKKCSIYNKSMSSVSAVVFQDNYNLASAGVADGVVKIWDLRKTYISKPTFIPLPRYQMKYTDGKFSEHGCTSLVFDSVYKKLYGCSTANKIFMFDCHAYTDAVVTYEGFRCDTYFIKLALSTDDQYLVCGSSDRKAYVWKTSKPGLPIYEFPGHNSEVTTVAWGSHNATKLVTCGDDNKILVWKTHSDRSSEKNDIFTTSSPYFKDNLSKTDSPPCSSVSNVESVSTQSVKRPVMKSIKSFFQPLGLFTSPSVSSAEQSVESQTSPVLSPSQVLNQNSYLFPNSSVLNTASHGKENHLKSSSMIFSNGQTKRKSSSNESTPKQQKTVRNKKRTSQAVKKEPKAEGTITNYFNTSLSPKE